MSMNVGLLKTKAERGYREAFEDAAPSLPGGADVQRVREAAISRFGELGLPNRRIEEWKYTDLRAMVGDALPLLKGGADRELSVADVKGALGRFGEIDAYLLVFVDGAYRAELSDLAEVTGVSVSSLADDLSSGGSDRLGFSASPENGEQSNAVLALNAAYAGDGYGIDIAAGLELDKPIVVADLRLSDVEGFSAVRNRITVGASAQCTIVEVFSSFKGSAKNGQTSTACEVSVGVSSKLQHIKCVRGDAGMTHLSNWIVDIEGEADYSGFSFSQGAGLVRNQVLARFNGEAAKLNLSGVFLARGTEHIDNTLVVDHKVPGCESRELFKGVLDGRARGVVQGKVIVRRDAQQTDGMQMAQVLMLSPDTEFDSKPELEIYADDVVCGHGSTVAEIDSDLLFYCRSRGIDEAKARSLLVQSFVGEAFDVIGCDGVVDALSDIVLSWLEERQA